MTTLEWLTIIVVAISLLLPDGNVHVPAPGSTDATHS